MAKRVRKGGERTLHIKAGKEISFPVPARHPLARFQTLTPVRSAKDVHEFLTLWGRRAAAREQPMPTAANVVGRLRKAKLSVLRLYTNDLRIDRGAVLTLNNALNRSISTPSQSRATSLFVVTSSSTAMHLRSDRRARCQRSI